MERSPTILASSVARCGALRMMIAGRHCPSTKSGRVITGDAMRFPARAPATLPSRPARAGGRFARPADPGWLARTILLGTIDKVEIDRQSQCGFGKRRQQAGRGDGNRVVVGIHVGWHSRIRAMGSRSECTAGNPANRVRLGPVDPAGNVNGPSVPALVGNCLLVDLSPRGLTELPVDPDRLLPGLDGLLPPVPRLRPRRFERRSDGFKAHRGRQRLTVNNAHPPPGPAPRPPNLHQAHTAASMSAVISRIRGGNGC